MHRQRPLFSILVYLVFLLCQARTGAAIGPDSGRLSGTVRSSVSGQGLAGVGVAFYPQFSEPFGVYNTYTGEDGAWESLDLPPGLYRVHAFNFGDLIGLVYPNVPCSLDHTASDPGCDVSGATLVEVKNGELRGGIDFVLHPGGEIVGLSRWQPGGEPAEGTYVEAHSLDGFERLSAQVDAAGNYRIGGLSPYRIYYLLFLPSRDVSKMIYPDTRCTFPACAPKFAGLFQVGLDQTRRADQDLPLPAELFGRVTNRATGAPVPGTHVVLEDRRSGEVSVVTTDAAGDYRFSASTFGVAPGSYSLEVVDGPGYLTHIYPGVDLGPGQIPQLRELAASHDLEPGSSRSLDLSIEPVSVLRGKVLGAGGLTGNCTILAFDGEGKRAGSTGCDRNGEYRLEVAPGSWRLLVFRTGYAARWVGGETCFGVYQETKHCLAQPAVFHQVGPRETRELATTQLVLSATIWGQVAASENQGFEMVDLYDSLGALLGSYSTFGNYRIPEVPPGRYYLRARSEADHGPRLYPDIPCDPNECDPLLGEPVELAAGEQRFGVDFVLTRVAGRCGNDEACLVDRRFRVKANWRDPLGQQGTGRSVYLGSDSLGITFFDPSNTEVFVKVLDACYPPFNHYWVLAAGLTDVAVELEVEDTVTGATASYGRPLGQIFAPIFDFTSFPCGAAAASPKAAPAAAQWEAPAVEPEPVAKALPEPQVLPEPLAAVAWPRVQERCFERYPEVSCLGQVGNQGSRFEIRGEWTTAQGSTGPMRQAFYAGEAIGLYFFGRENVEIFVKILDGCAINDHHWLLVAGLTDVGVDLRIRDLAGGGQKVFHTAPGQAFTPSIDVRAFPCSSLSSP